MYDISKTYALNGKAKESIEYLDEVIWKWDNLGYYASFILDLSFGGIYSSISETEEFKDALSKYNTLYSSQIE
jgi:hypothetical protein